MRRALGVTLAIFAATGCSTAESSAPTCTNESSVAPYGDAGVLPVRALPAGFPCAAGAVCYATIDDCPPGDWPDGAAAPASANATPFTCECPDGVWTCAAQSAAPPACTGAPTPPLDAGGG